MHVPSVDSDEDSERLHGEDTTMGEPLRESHSVGCEVVTVFLLWTIARRGRMMSLPGVFGAVMYGLLDRHGTGGGLQITMLPSDMIVSRPGVAGGLPDMWKVHPLLSSLPGVLGISWYNEAGGPEGTRMNSGLAGERERTSSGEPTLSSSATIPLPGVCGRSTSSTAGDVGLLLIRRSGSLSTKQPVGVRGLRFSIVSSDSTVHSGISISTSWCGSTAAQIHKKKTLHGLILAILSCPQEDEFKVKKSHLPLNVLQIFKLL